MQSVPELIICCQKTVKWRNKCFAQPFELVLINFMVAYFHSNRRLAKKYQAHKNYRNWKYSWTCPTITWSLYKRNGQSWLSHCKSTWRGYKVSIFLSLDTYMRKIVVLYMAKKQRTKRKQNTKQLWNYCLRCDKVIYKLWFEKYCTGSDLKKILLHK